MGGRRRTERSGTLDSIPWLGDPRSSGKLEANPSIHIDDFQAQINSIINWQSHAPTNSPMDCARCQIFAQLCEGDRGELHRNITELVDGVRSGCWWCIRILIHLQDVDKSLPGFLQGNPSDIVCTAESENSFPFQSSVAFGRLARHELWWSVGFEVDDNHSSIRKLWFFEVPRLHRMYLPDTPENNTNSWQTWEYIARRLENCEKNHKQCRQPPGGLPTRLLEIREDNTKLRFRLILTSNLDTRIRYITLSHRWGSTTPLKLTSENFRDFQVDIPQQEMSRTYVDAAIIAIRLRIQYLWIDSLCIVQDDNDWDQESGTMALVYQRAYCNIAATSSVDRSDGLFYERCPLRVFPHKIRLRGCRGLVPVSVMDKGGILGKLDMEPLYLRGWVYQERLLSTRNISFSRQLVYFECAGEFSCEAIYGTTPQQGFPLTRDFDHMRVTVTIKNIINMSAEGTRQLWYTIIESYSRTQVTMPSDKLVAISGIVRYCQPAFRSVYLAGLWRSNLGRDLCWFVGEKCEPVLDYRAPSWSWASVEGPVSFCRNLEYSQELVEFITSNTVPVVEANPYGAVQNACIRLIGLVIPVFHRGCDSCEPQQAQMHDYNKMTDNIEEAARDNLGYRLSWVGNCSLDYTGSGDGASIGSSLRVPVPVGCFFLPIVCDKLAMRSPLTIYCLILKAVTPRRGTYQRIGIIEFGFSSKENGESFLQFLVEEFRRCKVPSYEGDTLEKHEITLV